MTAESTRINAPAKIAFVCLECAAPLGLTQIADEDGVWACSGCAATYLQESGIAILLPTEYEDPARWQAFFTKHGATLANLSPELFDRVSIKTAAVTQNRRDRWEDEDVSHWNRKYAEIPTELASPPDANRNARLYARKAHLFSQIDTGALDGKVLLEIGCGDGASIRSLLDPRKYGYTYVATDYSFEALRYLKHIYQGAKNVVYVQCLGHRLPVSDFSLNYILCLGVLHHMPNKEQHVLDIVPKLKQGGAFLYYESYHRESRLSQWIAERIAPIVQPNVSAHEERVNRRALEELTRSSGRIVHIYHEYSPLFTALMHFCPEQVQKSELTLKASMGLDQLIIRTLGRATPLLSGGACFVVMESRGKSAA